MSAFRQYTSGLPSEADVHHGIRESLLLTDTVDKVGDEAVLTFWY